MSLTAIVEKENRSTPKEDRLKTTDTKEDIQTIYSPRLGRYVPLNLGRPKGEIQRHNIGMGPGSWY